MNKFRSAQGRDCSSSHGSGRQAGPHALLTPCKAKLITQSRSHALRYSPQSPPPPSSKHPHDGVRALFVPNQFAFPLHPPWQLSPAVPSRVNRHGCDPKPTWPRDSTVRAAGGTPKSRGREATRRHSLGATRPTESSSKAISVTACKLWVTPH